MKNTILKNTTKYRLLPLAAVIMATNTGLSLNVYADDQNTQTSKFNKPHNHTASGQLEEVIVSVSPIHNQHSNNARPVSVLNGDQLRRDASATLADTLSGQVGVSSASFGPGVGNPIIRGQSANRVKVMQDNLDTLDASNTSADHANTTEPLLADQIEILRGPSTLRFGSGAIGGVVNVIDGRIPSRQAEGISGALETRYSSVNDGSASVFRLDGGSGAFALHVDGLYRDSN
ncbi:TonB-dependent receptor plug domain-containing protein, partial [Pseudomaricurvus sp.]|uniref:TonB-dependent receptor plug domain-containing protein n=1 Tax=Pseudomaricurvus sp. TaxID=2004510 RepID=UPI003F6AA3AE